VIPTTKRKKKERKPLISLGLCECLKGLD